MFWTKEFPFAGANSLLMIAAHDYFMRRILAAIDYPFLPKENMVLSILLTKIVIGSCLFLFLLILLYEEFLLASLPP